MDKYPKTRAWAYNVLIAVFAILAGWNGWHAVDAADWLAVAAALLNITGAAGFTLARVNTPTHPPVEPAHEFSDADELIDWMNEDDERDA